MNVGIVLTDLINPTWHSYPVRLHKK